MALSRPSSKHNFRIDPDSVPSPHSIRSGCCVVCVCMLSRTHQQFDLLFRSLYTLLISVSLVSHVQTLDCTAWNPVTLMFLR